MKQFPIASGRKPASIARRVARGLALGAATVGCLAPQIVTAGVITPPLAPITWGTATTISGDSDVDTVGSLTYAYNFGSLTSATTQTVNGVTFSPFVITDGLQTVTQGNVTVSEWPDYLYSNLDVGWEGAGDFAGLGTPYKALLSSAVYAYHDTDITVELGGLTTGHSYRVQWWTNDSARWNAPNLYFESTTSSGSSGSVTLQSNTTGVVGGLGQYVIGTFTATASTASFTLSGDGPHFRLPLMNALQLRDTSVAVPEIDPAGIGSVLALLGGAFGVLERRRKTRG